MSEKFYSQFEIKAVDNEKRRIKGIASTPNADRSLDIVYPKGAVYKLPIPFLWQHDHRQPIGNVVSVNATDKGIEVEIELVQLDAPSQLAARLEEAWQSIKSGLVRGLSIGFSAIKYAYLENGGVEYIQWSWHELSAVTIPCNAEATITAIKSLAKQQAALGHRAVYLSGKSKSVGAPAKPPVNLKPQEGHSMDYAKSILNFNATKLDKQKRMDELMAAADNEGRTLDAAESEEYDNLVAEVAEIDKHVKRLETSQASAANRSVPVDNTPSTKAVASNRSGNAPAVIKAQEDLEPGIEFARYAMCLGKAKGELGSALSIAKNQFPKSTRIHSTLKAAVDAGTTTDATWARPLVEYNQFTGDFVEFLRPQTIIGRFGQGTIPSLRSIPFNVHVRGQTGGGQGYWVGEAKAKPLTAFAYNDAYLGYTKVANIAVLTEELIRFSDPSAERLVRDSLADALIARLDIDFIAPTLAGVTGVNPASITYGVTPIVSTGNTAEDVRTDVQAAMGAFIVANNSLAQGVWIMSAIRALALSQMRNALGQKEFPELSMMGGTFEGLPVIVSQYVPSDSAGDMVILVNAADVWLADDGQVVIDASREASLQMLDNPTNASNDATPTSVVSMFQTNSVALRAERYINWQKRRDTAVAVITAVNWGSAGA
jgi:HK97 family phage major capsid protein/HK97 family phage prohead protease